VNYNETDVVDTIVADIAANVTDLPAYGTWKYVEPRSLRKDVKDRWLAVFPRRIDPELLATPDAYYNRLEVVVAWYLPVFEGAAANTGEEAIVATALPQARLIRQHIQGYADGVPGLVNVAATLVGVEFDTRGSIGWVAEHTLMVEEFE
jgi:hypothetical protein